jgi:hypothetical protein
LLVFRFTVALPEFRLRFQALPPDSTDDQMFALDERLLNEPSVLRLPARIPRRKNNHYGVHPPVFLSFFGEKQKWSFPKTPIPRQRLSQARRLLD